MASLALLIIVVQVWTTSDLALQYCLGNVGFQQLDLQLEESTLLVVQVESVIPKAALAIAYPPVDFDGMVAVVVKFPPKH